MGISGDYSRSPGFPGYDTGLGESSIFVPKEEEVPFMKKKKKPRKFRTDEDPRNIKTPWSYI